MIYAGVDSDGTDHNQHAWIVPNGGGGLWREPDGTLRVCHLRAGEATLGVKSPASYSRPQTRATFTVPFEVSGEILLHSRMDDVWIFGENRTPTWTWAPNFHPVFVDEDNNIVSGLSPTTGRWSASGQIDGVYGIPRAEVFTAKMSHDAQLGTWHRFRMVVPEVGVHEVWWDDVLVYRVVEKTPPAAWWSRPLRAGLRLDFYDYSLRNLTGDDMTLYPDSYGTKLITLEQMVAKHGAKMHPEFRRRFFAYIESEGGRMGVGGGWRSTQPTKPGFAPDGRSFHQDQVFASGFVGYAAVDLVHVNPGQVHRSPTWAETAGAEVFGLHTFIKTPPEPWHIQCVEMRGWQTWVNAGRPDPQPFPLPGDTTTPPPIDPGDTDMLLVVVHNNVEPKETWLTYTGPHLSHVVNGHAAAVVLAGNPKRVDVTDGAQADGLIRSATTTTPCPPEWVNTPRGALWTSARG